MARWPLIRHRRWAIRIVTPFGEHGDPSVFRFASRRSAARAAERLSGYGFGSPKYEVVRVA